MTAVADYDPTHVERFVLIPIDLYTPELSPYARDVYGAARMHDMTANGVGYGAFPSYERLSELTGQSRRRVIKSMDELVRFGAVVKRHRFAEGSKSRHTSNLYKFPDIEARKASSQVVGGVPQTPEVEQLQPIPVDKDVVDNTGDTATSGLRPDEDTTSNSTSAVDEETPSRTTRIARAVRPRKRRTTRPRSYEPGIGIKAAFTACIDAWGGRIVSPEEQQRLERRAMEPEVNDNPVPELHLTPADYRQLREEIEDYVREAGSGSVPRSELSEWEQRERAALRAELETYLLHPSQV